MTQDHFLYRQDEGQYIVGHRNKRHSLLLFYTVNFEFKQMITIQIFNHFPVEQEPLFKYSKFQYFYFLTC